MHPAIRPVVIAAILVSPALSAHADEVAYAGTVVRASDGQPVPGAAVGTQFYHGGEHTWVSAETGAGGGFELRYEGTGGAAEIVAVADGYALGQAVTVPGRPARIELPANPGSITGTVLGEGEPVEGAEVLVTHFRVDGRRYDDMVPTRGREHGPRSITGVDGRFELKGLPRGSHVLLQVSAPGWATWYWPRSSERVPVGDEVAIRLEAEAVIEGRVVVAGRPVVNAQVSATPQYHGSLPGEAVSDGEGRYRIGPLTAGAWRVQATGPGGLYTRRPGTVTTEAGQTATLDIELTDLADAPIVSGTVTFADTGMPAAGAEIAGGSLAQYADDGPHWTAVTDEQGRYRLALPAGPVMVAYMANLEGYDWQGAEPRNHQIDLAPGGATADFVLHPAGEAVAPVPCFAIGPGGEPVAGALVYVGDEPYYGPQARDPIVADEQGRFTMSPSAEYEQRLLVTDPERRLCALETVSRYTLRLEANLSTAAWAVAKVVDTQGQPVPGIAAASGLPTEPGSPPGEGHLPVTGVSDERGQIRIGPLPPRQPLVFEPSWQCKKMLVEDVWAGLGEITFEPGEVRELPDLVLNPAGRVLEGRVRDLAGEPVSGATVLSTDGVFTKALATAGDDGRFRLEGLRTLGEVGVVAFSDEGRLAGAARCNPDDWPRPLHTRPIAGQPNEQEFVLVVAPLAALDGQVVDMADRPVVGAEVQVATYAVGDSPALPRRLRLKLAARSTQEGVWHLEGLVPGLLYHVYVFDSAMRDTGISEQVVPTGTETQSLRLRMRRW